MTPHPTGTVTFLFTDIAGSTRLWEHHHAWMEAAHRRQEALLRQAIAAHAGYAYKMVGDAFQAAFQTAPAALAAAVAGQQALVAEEWGAPGPLRVRMALHTGTTEERGDDYLGPLLNRVARLMAAGHGGQILLTATTYELVRDELPAGVSLRDLGERRLKDLIRPEHVWQIMAPGLPADFPPLHTLDARPNNLPRQVTALIGREKEAAAVAALLRRADVALVTLTGPGGIGKTRLGLQVAADLLDEYPDGAWFVDLVPVGDPALAPSALAAVLGVKEVAGQPLPETLRDYLRAKHLLLVLDNFEQILDAAPIVTDLLAAAPQVKALVTSREALDLYGEHEYSVPPLQLPDPRRLPALEQVTQYEAVRLFIERALARDPDFAVTHATAPDVAEICWRLDGLPLAIELAAARTRQMPPAAIRAQLDDRLGLLVGGPRDRTARQQSLRGAIAWSYDLLQPGEQQLFRRLGVFVGGWTVEAAEQVVSDQWSVVSEQGSEVSPADYAIRNTQYPSDPQSSVLSPQSSLAEALAALVDKSLVREIAGGGNTPRFGMLETIREYASAQLVAAGEAAAVRAAHLRYYLALAEEANTHLAGPEQGAWLDRLEGEHDNLRAALDWALAQDAPGGLRLGGALGQFWHVRGYFREGRERLTALLAQPAAQPPTAARAYALYQLAHLIQVFGEHALMQTVSEESLAIARALGDPQAQADALSALARATGNQGNPARKAELFEQAAALYRQVGDHVGLAQVLINLGYIYQKLARLDRGQACLEEAWELAQAAGNDAGVAFARHNLGWLLLYRGAYDTARFHLEATLAIYRTLGNPFRIAATLRSVAFVALAQGDPAALALAEESLARHRELGSAASIGETLIILAMIETAAGAYAGTEVHCAEAEAVLAPLGYETYRGWNASVWGQANLLQGDFATAHARFQQSIRFALAAEEADTTYDAVIGLARVALATGHPEPATRLVGAAARLLVSTLTPFPQQTREYEQTLAAARAALDPATFDAAWAEGRAWTPEQINAYALELPPSLHE